MLYNVDILKEKWLLFENSGDPDQMPLSGACELVCTVCQLPVKRFPVFNVLSAILNCSRQHYNMYIFFYFSEKTRL